MPGTQAIGEKILDRKIQELTSMVMCFEDAITEMEVDFAEANVLSLLDQLANAVKSEILPVAELPLIFLRVRNTEQFKIFATRLNKDQAKVLTGFVFPKFYSSNAIEYLIHYGMPILEGPTIAYRETRHEELEKLKIILKPFKQRILNIRVGGTDFSSLFGVRRGINSSIYDILTVRDCLSDILNCFGRVETGYVISAPVWEYFLAYKKDNIDLFLNENIHRSLHIREPILNDAIDGLLREIVLDKANGFVGKTIIHPSHLKYVNAMQAVTREEYEDAKQILETNGGVVKSAQANKMNEINPHKSWAIKITLQASAYGVVEDTNSYLKLCHD